MGSLEITLSDATAVRLAAAAAAANVSVAGFAAVLLAEALEARLFRGDSAPQAGVLPPGVPEVGGGGGSGPQPPARTPVAVVGAEVPDEGTVVALALALHRADLVGAAALMDGRSLSLLLADALAWINRAGINELGAEGWEARLASVLAEDAARRSASPPDDHSA